MPLDPSVFQQIRQPPSPIQNLSQIMGLQSGMADIQLKQAEVERQRAQAATDQAQADQRNRNLAAENTYMEGMKNPDINKRVHTGDFSDFEGKLPPEYLDQRKTQQIEQEKGIQANTKEQNINTSEALGKVTATITGLQSLIGTDGNLNAINDALPGAIGMLKQGGWFAKAGIPELPIDSVRDPKSIDSYLAVIGGKQAQTDKVLGQQKTQAETQASISKAAKDKADADLANFELNLRKNFNLADLQSSVDAQVPADPQFVDAKNQAMARAKLAFGASGKPEDAIRAIADTWKERVQPLLPETARAAGNKAASEATARIPAEIATRVGTANALNASGPELANVPVNLRDKVTTSAEKADADYSKAKASADSIKTVLDLAAAGNKAAGANAPLVGVGAVNAINGIRRISSAEIQQYGTAGSLLDKIQGKLQGWTEGQPIPKDVLDDMQALHQALRTSSYQQYTDTLNSINNRTHAKLTPGFEPPAAAGTAGGAATLPAKLSQSDVGKVYYSPKTGRNIKITAVNPADATQFQKVDQ